MASTLPKAEPSSPVRSLDSIRPEMAKAGLHRTGESEPVGSSDGVGFDDVIRKAVVQHYGSVKAAAISLKVDPSLMQREFEAGKFARLNEADPTAKAAIADALFETFGHLEDPAARVRRSIRDARRALDEVEQHLEYVRSA